MFSKRMGNYFYKLIVPFLLTLFFGCANIKQPTGGDKDLEAPVLQKSIPENNSTNYKGRVIYMEFDEYVDGIKLNENILISPIVESKYEIITKKKTVTIRFEEDFKENTTYNINMSESVKDLTEGNFVKNLSLAFSTGAFIDSLSVSGQVTDFVSGSGVKNISIQLYNTSDTNTIRNSKPRYFSKTDGLGSFSIHNIKEGTYHVYALNDQNKNYLYDNEKEDIAYINNVVVDTSVTDLKLGLTRTDKKAPEIISTKPENEYYLLSTNEGLESYRLKSDNQEVLSDLYDDAKTIRIFNNFNSKDSITLYYQFTDSSGNVANDTTKILFEEVKDKEKNKKNPFLFTANPSNMELSPQEYIKLKFNKPVRLINYPQIRLKKDSTLIPYTREELSLDSTKMNISILNKYVFKDTLVLLFDKGAFININGDSSPVRKVIFRNKNEERYGIMGGKIICADSNYIFQLLDKRGKVVDSKKNATQFYYKMLEPGEYQLKIIFDANKNGRWDPTDLDKNIPPERIVYYKEKINLRANWELLDLKFEAK